MKQDDAWRQELDRKRKELGQDLQKAHYDYEYPYGLNLKPGSELSKFIIDQVTRRTASAKSLIDTAKDEWATLDRVLSAYVPLDSAESAIKAKDSRKPMPTVIPLSYAARDTFLTYMASAFIKDPIFQFAGRGDLEQKVGVALLELVIEAQMQQFANGLHLMTALSDGFTYGIGALTPEWSKYKATSYRDAEVDDILAELAKDIMPEAKVGDTIRYPVEETIFEGNRFRAIDPYTLLLDPKSTVNDFHDTAEFCGWIYRSSAIDLLRREGDPEERCFNGKYVRLYAEKGVGRSVYATEDSGRNDRYALNKDAHQPDLVTDVDHIVMFIELNPSEWNVGDEDVPRKWMFQVSADNVVTKAQPLDLDHGRFPIAFCAPSSKGHEILPCSHLASINGLQSFADFEINMRIASVRKSINGMFVFDPSKFEWRDFQNAEFGKIIRMKPGGFGEGGIDNWFKQLPVTDITQNHVAELQQLIQLAREGIGTTDVSMGLMGNMPERPTARGMEIANSGAMGRLQFFAMNVGWQMMHPLSYMVAFNTLQFMQQDVAVALTGRNARLIRKMYNLDPNADSMMTSLYDLRPGFHVVPHNGALPNSENPQAWTTFMQTLMSNEMMAQSLVEQVGGGVLGLFLHWARINGSNSLAEFIESSNQLQPQVMPNEQVEQQVQAGNLVPMQEFGA